MTDTAVSESKAASAHASWGALDLDDSKPASQEFLANLPGVSGIPIYKVLQQVHPDMEISEKSAVTVNDLLCNVMQGVLEVAISLPSFYAKDSVDGFENDDLVVLDQRANESGYDQRLVGIGKELYWFSRYEILKRAKGAAATFFSSARRAFSSLAAAAATFFSDVKATFKGEPDYAREQLEEAYNRSIGFREIMSSVRLLVPGKLREHALCDGNRAVENFSENAYEMGDSGRQFPIEIVGHLASRVAGSAGKTIDSGGAVSLAATIEYLCAEILELAGNACRFDCQEETIRTIHLQLAVYQDEELSRCFAGFVQPSINPGRIRDLVHPIEQAPTVRNTSTALPASTPGLDESSDSLDYGEVYDALNHKDEKRWGYGELWNVTQFVKKENGLASGKLDEFVASRIEDILWNVSTRCLHRRERKVEMIDLVPVLLDKKHGGNCFTSSRYAGSGLHTLALTSCLPNVVFVKPDEDADKFTAAWWAARAAAVEKEVRQKAVEVDLEETKETKVAEDVTEEDEGSDDASSRPVLPYTGFLPYKAVYEYVRGTGSDFASHMSYCPHAIAAIGAAIEYDVSALIAKATAKAEKERERQER